MKTCMVLLFKVLVTVLFLTGLGIDYSVHTLRIIMYFLFNILWQPGFV